MRLQILTFITLAAGLQAQVYTPPAGNGGNSAPPANTTPQDSATRSQPQTGPSPFGQEIPMLDPSAETITVGGVTIPLGDNRLLKARFEKYLSQPPESGEAAEQYRKDVARILDAISPLRRDGKRPDLYGAFKMLPAAATYSGDANICMSLAESIYTSMLARQDMRGVERLNQAMEAEKKQRIRDSDWQAAHERDSTLGSRRVANSGAGEEAEPAKNPGKGVNSLRYQENIRRIAEIEAIKVANAAQNKARTLTTKTQYQVNMIQWFMQRRFEHVLMASRFYNQIWRDGDSTLHVKKNSDIAKIFSDSIGVNPTVSSLDALSNEAIREAEKAIEAFDTMLARGELHNASQRLMEAFALGEYLAPLATLEIEKKLKIQAYFRDLNELYGAMQARDYVKAKELSSGLKNRASDFPSSKVDSAVSGYTLAANLLIEEAKAQLIARESDKAAEKIKQATEIWPTNPKLQEFSDLIGTTSTVVRTRNDFDRLLSEGNYREIARRQYEIAPVIQGDEKRLDAFTQIITNLTKIETALGKAEEFSRAGQNYAAWEQLAEIREQFPDDPKLGRQLELLAPEVADFTRALTKAKDFEGRTPQQTGTALSWYLKARSIHPQSEMAREGVMRMAGVIMPTD